jgi:UDPglucose 6-dehydrogenase
MRVAVIGTGYVGLVSGACLTDCGHNVICVDKDHAKIRRLQAGFIPVYEPGLALLVERNLQAGRLAFATDIHPSVGEADILLIAVGTPSRPGDGFPDLTSVFEVARYIAPRMDAFITVVIKSTVPVGTGDAVEGLIRKLRPEAQFEVVTNPEFLREGAAVEDFKCPDRIVVGTNSKRARRLMTELYRPLFVKHTPMVFTDRRTAEMIKYAANAFLAMKVVFINEMADLCEAVGANVEELARGVGLDPRIGTKFLSAGPGYGGSCFPKDMRALMRIAQLASSPLQLIETVVELNERRKAGMAERIISACHGTVNGKTIAVLGLTFKPNTDDMRNAPSVTIIRPYRPRGRKCAPSTQKACSRRASISPMWSSRRMPMDAPRAPIFW